MEKQVRQAALGICAAVIGAGFATGREVVTFFSRFGDWSWLGVGVAALAAGALTHYVLKRSACCPGRSVEGLCSGAVLQSVMRAAFLLLMTVTGAVMLAGAGNVFALTLPIGGARWIGIGVTLVLGLALSRREIKALAALGSVLTVCLLAVMVLGLAATGYDAAEVEQPTTPFLRAADAGLHGLLWSGFNLTFAAPLLCRISTTLQPRVRCRLTLTVALALAVLLALGNALLLRHPLLQSDEMPLIRLLSGYGGVGYTLGCAALYLAMLTTLIAALSGFAEQLGACRIPHGLIAGCVIGVTSLLGFGQLVESAYPVLGGVCLTLLLAALHTRRKKDKSAP